jgi:glycosyltransferase involved in cell wall biosynthesis
MKIAFLSSFYPYTGEIPIGNAMLYRTIERSNEVKAFNFSLLYPELVYPGKEKFADTFSNDDIIHSQRLLNTANPASYYFTAQSINFFAPDLLLTRFWLPYMGASIGGTAKLVSKKIKKLALIDSMRAENSIIFEKKLNKLFVDNYDAFIVFNQQSKDDLLSIRQDAHYVEHPYPFFTTNENKVEQHIARKILNIPIDKKNLLFYGDTRYYKGLETIFRVLSELDDTYHLLIAGTSISNFEYENRKINDFNIKNKVSIISHIPNINEVPYIFAASNVLLLAVEREVQQEIISDAFSFELPVIATDVGKYKKYFDNFGIIIEKLDSELLKNAIVKFFNENMQDVFMANLKEIRYTHSWESLATIIYDIYDRLKEKEDITIY